MDRVALILADSILYWNSILTVLSAAAAVSFFLAFYLSREGSAIAAAVSIPAALVASLFLSRLIHWYFRPDSYPDIVTAMTDYTSGSYALSGIFAGCALTALLVRVLGLEKCPGRLWDAMSLGICSGIGLGRLACFFSAADRGQLLDSFRDLPIAFPVVNPVSGAAEYRFATFLFQAAAAGLIFLILLFLFLRGRIRSGDISLLFALLYGMSQVILDSTRYDSLYLRSNGFLRVAQLAGAAAMVCVSAVFSVRVVRARGFRVWYLFFWLAMAGLLGGAGYMEYYVQRHGDRALFAYTVMTLCLAGAAAAALTAYGLSLHSETKPE